MQSLIIVCLLVFCLSSLTTAAGTNTSRSLSGRVELDSNVVWEWTSPFKCASPGTKDDWIGQKTKVDQLWVWGERNTGTGYTQRLFGFNLDIPNEVIGGLDWKHGFMHEQQLHQSTHTIQVFVVRDVFAWLGSMRRNPHHANSKMYNLKMDEFVRKNWMAGRDNKLDWDPVSHKQFASILKLRTARLKDWLAVRDCLPYQYTFRYEELYRMPEQIVKKVTDDHHVKLKNNGKINTDICVINFGECVKNQNGKLDEKQTQWFTRAYMNEFTPATLQYMLENHDWETEAAFGFDYSYVKFYL